MRLRKAVEGPLATGAKVLDMPSSSSTVQTLDFSRSFFTFGIDLERIPPKTISAKPRYPSNFPRVVAEATCELTSLKNKKESTRYVLSASCKSENVAEDSGLWMTPNADVCFILSEDEFLVFKSWAKNGTVVKLWPPERGVQPERHSSAVKDAWISLNIDLFRTQGQLLGSADEVVEATLANKRLVARMEYDEEDYHVRIEHPIKTINVNRKYHYFQTDTGPILLPDLSEQRRRTAKRRIEILDLAFEAFNSADWAEFVINVSTPVAPDVSVNHYSKFRRIDDMKNAVIALA
jgi:hypothetical protein